MEGQTDRQTDGEKGGRRDPKLLGPPTERLVYRPDFFRGRFVLGNWLAGPWGRPARRLRGRPGRTQAGGARSVLRFLLPGKARLGLLRPPTD